MPLPQYWLLKSEPECFSIDALSQAPNQTTHWDGVRNYQARNLIRDTMRVGDLAFFYHSNCAAPGIVGIVEIVSPAYPDFTAWDPESEHPDPKSTPINPRWFMVDVRFQRRLNNIITLSTLKQQESLSGMKLLKKGNRLSVLPVSEFEWQTILKLTDLDP